MHTLTRPHTPSHALTHPHTPLLVLTPRTHPYTPAHTLTHPHTQAAIKEERTAGWAHLPLPEMLRHAMDEAMAKLQEAHSQQLGALKAEHTAALERAERESKEVSKCVYVCE